jgi:hypothetical protein
VAKSFPAKLAHIPAQEQVFGELSKPLILTANYKFLVQRPAVIFRAVSWDYKAF